MDQGEGLSGNPMRSDPRLSVIRSELFYGLLDYTKNFPDFSIPQRFLLASPSEGTRLLHEIGDSLREEKKILLYIHLPFCSSECVFCNAFPQKASKLSQERYIDSLLKEIEIYSQSGILNRKSVECIYFGGGTPTAFSNRDIQRILSKIEATIDIPEGCNITSEAHPRNLVNNDRIGELSGLGINRISIGCQTFDRRVLELCSRSNSESEAKEIVQQARSLGLSTNIDMMIGLPGQTLEGLRKDLDLLADIAPDSIEYMRHEIVNPLAILLYRNNPDLLVKDDELFWMVYHTQKWMEEKGYEQNGRFESEKQFPYRYHWLKELPFIALGSRSRSYTKTLCYDKHEDPSLYSRLVDKGVFPVARYMALNEKEQMYRSLFLSLQVKKGLDLGTFERRFGKSGLEVFAPLLKQLTEYGCVSADDSSIRLSRFGSYFVEDVCCFIIDHALEGSEYPTRFRRIPHSSGGVRELPDLGE
jgi:oxygen-independent coproporphyrinogen-3 oxidase